LTSGRIPVESRVRRSAADEWTALAWTGEFGDLLPKSPAPAPIANASVSSNGEKTAKQPEFKGLGLRGMAAELATALDNALSPVKLKAATGLGLLLGLAGAFQGWSASVQPSWEWIGNAIVGLGVLLALCLVSALITQITFIELSRLRPARAREMRSGLGRHTIQIAWAQIVGSGFILAISLTLMHLPRWLQSTTEPGWPDALIAPLIALRVFWEIVCWPLWTMLLLFAPIAVIEEGSLWRSSVEWLSMARRHVGRLLLYEAMAILFGVLVSAPFLVPALLVTWSEIGQLGIVAHSTWSTLLGLALTPLLAYLPVANVFIYLKLRYEFSQRQS
jgi:hypothetical protein